MPRQHQQQSKHTEIKPAHGGSDLDAAIALLQQLDASALHRRWRALVGGALPKDLGRSLALRVLAYKLQAERLGDLDRVSRSQLAAALSSRSSSDIAAAGQSSDIGIRFSPAAGHKAELKTVGLLRPGTSLQREHGGTLHRVTVLDDGFGWNGRTYDSLSHVAFAITGTRWNGPRFFGLREKISRPEASGKPGAGGGGKLARVRASRATPAIASDAHP